MKLVPTKTVERLLQSLNNDPRLQALDDTTVLSEEQHPVAFDALIMRIKDAITLTTTVDTLNYNDAGTQTQSIPSAMRIQLKEKQVKLREILQLNPTIDNPLDELTYSHWIHRVTNICLNAAQMALSWRMGCNCRLPPNEGTIRHIRLSSFSCGLFQSRL
jgi:hypothetical protein